MRPFTASARSRCSPAGTPLQRPGHARGKHRRRSGRRAASSAALATLGVRSRRRAHRQRGTRRPSSSWCGPIRYADAHGSPNSSALSAPVPNSARPAALASARGARAPAGRCARSCAEVARAASATSLRARVRPRTPSGRRAARRPPCPSRSAIVGRRRCCARGSRPPRPPSGPGAFTKNGTGAICSTFARSLPPALHADLERVAVVGRHHDQRAVEAARCGAAARAARPSWRSA